MLHQLSTVVTGGILAVALLLSAPTTTALSLGGNSENLQPPQEQQHPLITEIDALDASIESIVTLLSSSAIPEDDAILSKAAKLVRRIRSLVYATEPAYLNGQEQRVADRQNARHVAGRREKYARVRRHERAMLRTEERRLVREKEERKMLRLGGGGGDGGAGLAEAQEAHEAAMLREEELRMEVEHPRGLEEEEEAPRDLEEESYEDRLERSLWHEVIEFPECEEMFIADCINEIKSQLDGLGREINDWVVHEKRKSDGDGYNKVVIITDMTASVVKGQNNDGHVTYPFEWDNSCTGFKAKIGIDGEFDCHLKTPQECCSEIQESLKLPNGDGILEDCPDMKGNVIDCHFFVPWGGVGNKKHDDRVIINLSPDGRVHEPPQIA